jgi:hypothetical protein
MKIDKITVINNCQDSVYFGQSHPRNVEIKAGDRYDGDWMIGGENVVGRLMFTYDSNAFKGKVSGNANNAAWIEIAGSDIKPGQTVAAGALNFANQVGYIDLDLQVSAMGENNELVCGDAKARTALDTNECKNFIDRSGELQQFQKRPFCNFVYANDQVKCATSANGVHACTSAYANYISDHSMLWKPDGKSATSGNWMAQPRSTGRSSGEKGFPTNLAKYEDGFVGRPTLNGRVGCSAQENGPQAVNFECFESCCLPSVVGLPWEARKQQCESEGGVSAGTQGFLSCKDTTGVIHVKNLEIQLCPARSDLSAGNVKMPSCPTGEPQNPQTWTPSYNSGSAVSSANGQTSTTTSASSNTDGSDDASTTSEPTSTDGSDQTSSTTASSTVDRSDQTSTTTEPTSTDGSDQTSTTSASSTFDESDQQSTTSEPSVTILETTSDSNSTGGNGQMSTTASTTTDDSVSTYDQSSHHNQSLHI